MPISRRELLGGASALIVGPTVGAAAATSYPSRTVKVLVPYAPGGPADILARVLAEKLASNLGQAFVVENVGGAGGNIGMGQGARAAPDGYTVLVVPPNIVVNPAMYATVPYDPYRHFQPISVAVTAPTVLTVHPSVKATTAKELVELIQVNPGKFSFASPGTGTPPHLIGEEFRVALGLDLVHVPFNSAGQAIASTLAGHTPLAFTSLPPAVPLVKDGNIRALAVTGSTRSTVLPSVPTMAEQGYRAVQGEGWFALVAPAGVPKDIIDLLFRETARALSRADVQDKLNALGFDVVIKSPEDSAALLRAEGDKWAKVIAAAKIKAD
jgi:tripartite-type tricarboxylate transporter receptor subunit TctC